jgi:hypothetical protein
LNYYFFLLKEIIDGQTIQNDIKRLTEMILSGNSHVVYSQREGITLSRNNSKLDRQFQLFILEPCLDMCIHMYNYFQGKETVTILNGSYTNLEDEYDCFVFTGNCKLSNSIILILFLAFGLPESNKSWIELAG